LAGETIGQGGFLLIETSSTNAWQDHALFYAKAALYIRLSSAAVIGCLRALREALRTIPALGGNSATEYTKKYIKIAAAAGMIFCFWTCLLSISALPYAIDNNCRIEYRRLLSVVRRSRNCSRSASNQRLAKRDWVGT
jgi:hypothetical protein